MCRRGAANSTFIISGDRPHLPGRSIVGYAERDSGPVALQDAPASEGPFMPAPTTIEEFLDLVKKSGVVEEKRLAAHLERNRAAGTLATDPLGLATQLVQEGVLTHFQ